MGSRAELHEERLAVVARVVVESGARSVLDLGCGDGELLARLAAEPHIERLVGIDISGAACQEARLLVGLDPLVSGSGRVQVRVGSFTRADANLQGFEAAVLLETLEHVDPGAVGVVERVVFGTWRPDLVLVTTPNADYNPLLGLRPGHFRHPDHRFEWSRSRFRAWAEGVGSRNGYRVELGGIGPVDRLRGAPTQTARFQRTR